MSRVSPRDRQFAEWLDKLRVDPQRGREAMAGLKRALGKRAGQVPAADRYILPWLPAHPSHREEDDETAYYLVASLFASHQKGWTSAEEHRGATNFGASMRLLAEILKNEGPERRFVGILNSDSSDLHEHLRHAVSYLKSQSIGIDWAQLLADIRSWKYEDRRVQREWARAFWGETAQPPGDKQ